jgi:hypothetical protein
MSRLPALAIAVAVLGCTASQPPRPEQAAGSDPPHHVNSEPAPMIDPLDYHMPPDARDRMCDATRLANRDNSFATVTKATTSYYCF